MKTYQRFLSILGLAVLLPFSGLITAAQDQDQGYSDQAEVATNAAPDADAVQTPDPPARAARLQYMSGSVSLQPQGTGEWVTGQLNRPLTNADNVWADKDSKAEISVGTGLIRIDSESSLTLTNIGESTIQLQLHQGAMNLHVRRLYDNESYEVDTPNQAFTVLKPGDYRFDVDSDADKTVITVWRGEGESSANGQTVKIRENQQARFGDGTISADDIHEAPAPDSFDEWAQSRDGKLDHSASARYVSPDVVGYEDLDEYGNWKHSDEYGDVWVPNDVGPGWAPYTDGHWVWENPWGWTWVDYDPWGYAPFHYGRWVYWGDYWGWAPGPIWARPYYAPALVAWFGGPGWGVGFGGGYGWCPLGFGEPFVPWYGASFGYFRGVNITNTHFTNVNITNVYNNNFINGRPRPGGGGYGGRNGNFHYANMRAPGGFTAVSRNTLVNSLPVAHNNIRVSPNQLNRISPVRAVDAHPTRTTMLGGNARSRIAPPPHAFSRPVVSRASIGPRGTGGFRSGAQSNGALARPTTQPGNVRGNMQRPENMPARGTASGAAIGGSRSIPRPPSGGFENRGSVRSGSPMESARANAPGYTMRPQSVPRPPSASMSRGGERPSVNSARGSSAPQMSPPRGAERPQMSAPRAGERPQMSAPRGGERPQMSAPRGGERPQMSAPHGSEPGNSRGNASPANGPRSEMRVPRPAASSAPRGYSAEADRGSYSAPRSEPSYQANNRSYGNEGYSRSAPSYSRPSSSYGGGSNSRPVPSYDRGSYGRPAPSYGGGSYGRQAPSYGGGNYGRPAPSYGGGGGNYGRSMPSYGGGGGARSYGGGGGGSYGGGGGSHGGGGGHASSSGSGGGRSGGGHGGRH